jgi:transcriptional regulator with XRE-family HTH domain
MATDSADQRTRRRLRELREQAGLSLEDVGRHAGMAASTVSRLESGARRLTLGHRRWPARWASASTRCSPHRSAPTRAFAAAPSRATGSRSCRSPAPERPTGCTRSKVLYPADERVPTPTVHDGHDWIYVLSGRLRLVLGDEDFVLEPGEAAEFSCRVPHALGAVDGPAEALAIFGPHGERIHTR